MSSQRRLPRWCNRGQGRGVGGCGGAWGLWKPKPGEPCCLSPLGAGSAPRTCGGSPGAVPLRVPSASSCRRWTPGCCVRSARSTSTTSARQWLDSVSGLEGPLSGRRLRPLSGPPSASASPLSPTLTGSSKLGPPRGSAQQPGCQGVLAQKTCPGSSLTACQGASISPPHPPGNGHLRVWVGLQRPEREGAGSAPPGGMFSTLFPLKPAWCCSGQLWGAARGQVSLYHPGTPP